MIPHSVTVLILTWANGEHVYADAASLFDLNAPNYSNVSVGSCDGGSPTT